MIPRPCPTLRAERLTLRPHRIEDFEAYAALFASDRAVFMGGPLSRRDAWFSFASDVAQWALMGIGAWAIEADGAFAGQVGIQKPDHFPEIELGWFVLDGFEGAGLAFEAAITARRWAHDVAGVDGLVSYVSPANHRSIALAERMGARPDDGAAKPDADDIVYRHPSPAGLRGA